MSKFPFSQVISYIPLTIHVSIKCPIIFPNLQIRNLKEKKNSKTTQELRWGIYWYCIILPVKNALVQKLKNYLSTLRENNIKEKKSKGQMRNTNKGEYIGKFDKDHKPEINDKWYSASWKFFRVQNNRRMIKDNIYNILKQTIHASKYLVNHFIA